MIFPQLDFQWILDTVSAILDKNNGGQDLESLRDRLEQFDKYCIAAPGTDSCARLLNETLGQLHLAARDLESVDMAEDAWLMDIQALPLAIWAARSGIPVNNRGPVVHALAQFANRLSEPDDLKELYELCQEIYEAAVADGEPLIHADDDTWKLLLVNRAIIATRSLDPDLMEAAYTGLSHYLPDTFADFIREGMRQLDIIDYPPHVRQVIQKYHQLATGTQTLH